MNVKSILFALLIGISLHCSGQDFQEIVLHQVDSSDLYINDGSSTELFYLKLVPHVPPKGAIIVLPSGGETIEDLLQQIDIPQLSYKRELVTIVPSINWGTEDRAVEIQMLNEIIRQVIGEDKIPEDRFVLGGLSNGGMISLVYAQEAARNPENTAVRPMGVFALDVPLDKTHMYEYCQRELARNFSAAGMGEARWIMDRFERMYGGSPQEYPDRYIAASIYSNGVKNGGNAQYLKDMPIRMYTDLDVDWLMEQRRRDLYDWNGTDIVAMINDLKLMGNQDANVIITMGKGVRLDGRRHPHSWSIMDNEDCINWIMKLIEE